jgi:diguanylate cyclase (GGDEF)-like protein/PAS domain S-box-containing protein
MLGDPDSGRRPARQPVPDLARSEVTDVVRNATQRLADVIETQRAIAAAELDLGSVMQLICERTRELTHADASTVMLLEDDALVFRAAAGFISEQLGVRVGLDDTFPGWVHRHKQPALCVDSYTDPRFSALGRSLGIRSMIGVPLRHGDSTIGQLQVISRASHGFCTDDLQTLELLSVVLSAATSNAAELEAKREQLGALSRFRTMFENAPIGIVRVDTEGRMIESNPAVLDLIGYSPEELATVSFAEFTHPDDVERNLHLFGELLEGKLDSYQLEKRYFRKSGELIWCQVTAALERDADGNPIGSISMIENITERKLAEAALVRQSELNEHQALHDALTDLPNRTLFRDRIERAILTAERESTRIAVLMMDLDRFKEINDSLGHHAGDSLLCELGERLQTALRASDTIARLGGDEFGVLLPQHSDHADVIHVIDRIREALDEPIVLDDLPLTVEASIGVALYPDDGTDVDTLLQRADVAMYMAKSSDTSYAFYEASADHCDPARLTLVGELRRAMERGELLLHYQPKAVLASGKVTSVEALLRWQHPERGLLPPDEFIPLAQQTGLIKPLTLYVVDEALRQCRDWQSAGIDLSVAVNLSMRNLLDVELPDQIEQLLARWELDPALLELEITESTMLADPLRTKAVLERLSAMGIRLSIDDFGTGYSSLAYLRRLPVDEIKIDRSFVINMTRDDDDETIVRSTIDLGRNLGLEVVAEGVETEEIWERVRSLGCTVAQGYYLSRPVPAAELEAWLRRRSRVDEAA